MGGADKADDVGLRDDANRGASLADDEQIRFRLAHEPSGFGDRGARIGDTQTFASARQDVFDQHN